MHRLFVCTALLTSALHLCQGSLLHDECTVVSAYDQEEKVVTFSNIVHLDIAAWYNPNPVITIENEEVEVKLPFMEWARVTCNLTSRTCEKDSDGDDGSDQENQMEVGPKKRTFGIKYAYFLFRCMERLPNIKVDSYHWRSFPRSNKERETFAIIPEVTMELKVNFFGEDGFLCWNSDEINDGSCSLSLPPNKSHVIIADFAAKQIQNANGETLYQHQGKLSYRPLWFRSHEGSGWIVQLLNETQRPETTADTAWSPFKELKMEHTVIFPRSNNERETFVIFPEVEMEVKLLGFGGGVSLCWDGGQVAVKESECQGLPPSERHVIFVDFAAKKIQNANGKTLYQHQGETSNEEMRFQTENGSALIVQLFDKSLKQARSSGQKRDGLLKSTASLIVFMMFSLGLFI